MEKKRIQPRDILKISWFLSSVLCCAFWELCGGKKGIGIKKKIKKDQKENKKGSKKNKAAIDDPLTRNASRDAKTRVLVRFQSTIDDPLTRHAFRGAKTPSSDSWLHGFLASWLLGFLALLGF